MSEPLCPMTPDGRHKKRPWADKVALSPDHVRIRRSGYSCTACHKTWEWKGNELLPTYPEGLI